MYSLISYTARRQPSLLKGFSVKRCIAAITTLYRFHIVYRHDTIISQLHIT